VTLKTRRARAALILVSTGTLVVVRLGAKTARRRVLVFGGTFDPPHLAHAQLPMLAAAQLGCDEILYVPAAINPLKSGTKLKPAPPEHRLAMLLLAVADVPGAKISTIELDRKGKSYTIDTLRALHKQQGNSVGSSPSPRLRARPPAPSPAPIFHLLIGADQALDFHRWKNWQEIIELATPAVMLRPPWSRRTHLRQGSQVALLQRRGRAMDRPYAEPAAHGHQRDEHPGPPSRWRINQSLSRSGRGRVHQGKPAVRLGHAEW
jgi:nicotinate (nicotinamide) nucleotide adenylyltransferase